MDLALLASTIGLGIALIYVFILFRVFSRLKQQTLLIDQQDQLIDSLQQRVTLCTNEQEEMRSATLAMFNRVKQLEGQVEEVKINQQSVVEQVKQQQQNIQEQDPQSRFYNKGMKLISQGASIEELMSECEMPLAEAELLFNLHNKS